MAPVLSHYLAYVSVPRRFTYHIASDGVDRAETRNHMCRSRLWEKPGLYAGQRCSTRDHVRLWPTIQACPSFRPRCISFLARVKGFFHCRQRRLRSLRRNQPSSCSNTPLSSASRKQFTQPRRLGAMALSWPALTGRCPCGTNHEAHRAGALSPPAPPSGVASCAT
jgi:hypothetical protein